MSANPVGTTIVDAHCHLWRRELSEKTWLTPDLKLLFRTFDPDDLSRASGKVDVSGCVLIEAGKTPEENRRMQQMAASSPLIAAFLAYVDLENPKLAEELDDWQQDAKFRGVRMGFEGHPDPDVLKHPGVIAGLREIARRGLVFEFLVRTVHLEDVLAVCRAIPELSGVIEHLAKPDTENRSDFRQWQRQMQALAEDTNVGCKLSLSPRVEQLGDLLEHPGSGWPVRRIKPCVEFIIEHFGYDRLMWGSDWPICLLVDDYRGTWQVLDRLLAGAGDENRDKVFGQNAIRFYRLNPNEECET